MQSPKSAPRFGQELGATLRLAAPLATAQLAQIAMGTTDTILLGSLGQDAIAAGGLGANLYFTLVVVVQGGLASVGILVAHARGSGQQGRIALALRGGFALAGLVSIPLMLLLWYAGALLAAIGEPPALAAASGAYDRILLLAIPASMWLGVQRTYLSAMARPWIMMVVSLVAVVANGVLNYGLIHGAFGLPRMGYIGSCTATAITLWAMCAAIAVSMRMTRALRPFRLVGPVDWRVTRELAHLGWPIAVTVGVEIALFSIAGILIGTFGAAALAAHQIGINVAAITFMVPFGIGQAANVRVGFHMGAGKPRAAEKAALAAFLLGVGFMAMTASAMLLAPHAIASIYLTDADPANAPVVALGVRLLAIAAFFQVFDGAQTIAAGALRGLKDTRVPMLAAAFGYWGVGFAVAWVLGFHFGYGVIGIWWGLALGLAAAALLLGVRLWRLMARLIADADRAGIPQPKAVIPELGSKRTYP